MPNDRIPGASRRAFLTGVGAAALTAGGIATAADQRAGGGNETQNSSARGTGPADRGRDERATQRSRPVGEARIGDVDLTRRFENRIRLAADPTAEDDGVVHVTSDGVGTQDYVFTAVDLQGREDGPITLADLRDRGLTYDAFAGDAHEHAAPGEAFLLLRGRERGRGRDRVTVVYRTASGFDRGEWITRDVADELERDGWQTIDVPPGRVDAEDERVRVSARIVGSRIGSLAERGAGRNVADRFAPDTEVVGIALGVGHLAEPAASDLYLDTMQVAGESHAVPAMVAATPAIERTDDALAVTLSFDSATSHGIDLAELDADSVRLSRYAGIARPLEGTAAERTAVAPERIDADAESATVRFDREGVERALGDRSTVLIWGTVGESGDAGRPVTFLAVDELDGR